MRRVAILVLACVAGACGGGGATATSLASTTGQQGEPIVIKERVVIAAAPGAEPIATGEILEGSTLGGEPFCAGGTLVDSHGSTDPSLRLIVETITCPEGTVSLAFAPDLSPGVKQTGSWIIVGGSGAFETLRGSGDLEVVYGKDADAPTDVTITGTVRR